MPIVNRPVRNGCSPNSAVVVGVAGRPVAILSGSDLLEFLASQRSVRPADRESTERIPDRDNP
jgi:hypothetical protein